MLDMQVPALPMLKHQNYSLVSHTVTNGKRGALMALEMVIAGIKCGKSACRQSVLSVADFTRRDNSVIIL
jgi:hypothetical protein